MKILCIPYSHTLSHVSRPLAVAIELRRRGHEVVFAGESPKKSFIEHEGFPVFPLYETDPDLLYGNIRSGKIRFVSGNEIERMISADLGIFQEVKPDLVLTDGRFTAALSTHIAKLRHAAIVNVSSTEYRALPYVPFFDWLPERLVNRNGMIWNGLESLNLRLEMALFDAVMHTFNKLSTQYGATKTVTATNCLAGKDITLLADIPEYFPTRNLPANYYYVGPLTWKGNTHLPDWWPLRKNGSKIVYITMGTTGIADFFSKVHHIFLAAGMRAIMTTGGQTTSVETVPDKIYCESFIDGDKVMEESDLVICHGGNGTIYQALTHGKPIIGIPTIPDQQFNMRRVEALGVGRTLSWKEFLQNPERLIDVARSVMSEPSYYTRARRLGESVAQYDGARKSADIISAITSC